MKKKYFNNFCFAGFGILFVTLFTIYLLGHYEILKDWLIYGILISGIVLLFGLTLIGHCRMKKRLNSIRIDIKETVDRLKNRELTGDEYAVDDAIDFLCGINNSYADEVPLLTAELENADEEETLNFIICVLKIIDNSLNEKIISLLEAKIYLIGNKITTGNTQYNTFDTIYYIFDYMVEQGAPYKEQIKDVLLKLSASNVPYKLKKNVIKTMKRLNCG